MSGGSKAGPSSQTVKNGTSTENLSRTQQTTLPDWYLNQWQSILDQGNSLANGGLALPVAGLMPDQLLASRLAGQTAQDYYNRTQIPAYDVFGMGNQWDKGVPQAAMAAANIGGAAPEAERAKVINSTAAQLKPTDPIPFMNPFIDSALDPVLNKMGMANAEAQAGIGAQAAAAGAFGGSREAVSKMLSDRNYRDSVAQTSGQMLGQGWQQAVAQATGNVANQQQSNLLNAQLGTNVNLSNARSQDQLTGQMAGLNAQLGTQASMANAAAQNAMTGQHENLSFQGAQADAGRFLDAVRLQQALDAQGAQTGMGIASGLAQLGGQQQATTQNALDWYWKELGNLSNLLKIGNPGNTVSTTGTSTTNENSTANTTSEKPIDWASIGLGGLGAAGKFFGF